MRKLVALVGALTIVVTSAVGSASAATASANAGAPVPIRTLSVESGGAAFSPSGRVAYIVSTHDVFVVKPDSGEVIGKINVGQPVAEVVSRNGATLYVLSDSGKSVTVIDTSSRTVTASYSLNLGPADFAAMLAVAPSGRTVYVAIDGMVDELSLPGGQVSTLATVTSAYGTWLSDLTVSSDDTTLYTSVDGDAGSSGQLDKIDTATGQVTGMVTTTYPAVAVALSPNGKTVYVAATDQHESQVTFVDARTGNVTKTVDLAGRDTSLAPTPDGSILYAAGDFSSPSCSAGGVTTCTVSPCSGGCGWQAAVSPQGSPLIVGPEEYDTGVHGNVADVTATPAHRYRTVTVSWRAPNWGHPPASYTVQVSTDGEHSWHDVASGAGITRTRLAVRGPGEGGAATYRVRINKGTRIQTPIQAPLVAGHGTGSQRLTILTAGGKTISGGRLTWSHGPGPSTLTARGQVFLPAVEPGRNTVTLSRGVLPDGTTVYGTWHVILGTAPQTLRTPTMPALLHRSVVVQLANGVRVRGATVRANLAVEATRSGFLFHSFSRRGTTDDSGRARVVGFRQGALTAQVIDTAGGPRQSRTVSIANPTTRVTLPAVPWLTANATTKTVPVGKTAKITFTARRGSLGNGRVRGVTVTLTPPAGYATRRCHGQSKLTGRTGRSGTVTLRLCGSVSGAFAIRSSGAIPTRTVRLRVPGSVPTAPRDPRVRAPKAGQARLTWTRPRYSGGAKITAYKAVATLGKKKHTVVLHDRFSSVFKHLAQAQLSWWTFRVYAITRNGRSRAAYTGLLVA